MRGGGSKASNRYIDKIEDEKRQLLRHIDQIWARWGTALWLSAGYNIDHSPSTHDRERHNTAKGCVTLGDSSIQHEEDHALRAMAKGKAMELGELRAELLHLALI